MKNKFDLIQRIASIMFLVICGVACSTNKNSKENQLVFPEVQMPPSLQPVSIKIGNFLCNDAITAQATRNVFIEVLSKSKRLRLAQDGETELVIEGTITHGEGGSAGAKIGAGSNWAAGKAQSVGGEYVSGVTAVVSRRGQVFTSVSWGQTLDKGGKLLPPEYVARETAGALLNKLESKYLRARYDGVVWCGLDYSKCKIIGDQSLVETADAFQKLTVQWNDLFIQEMLPVLERGSRTTQTDTQAVKISNKSKSAFIVENFRDSPEQSILSTHITKEGIAELVRSFSLKSTTGTGWVFVVDRLVKNQESLGFYVVHFDVPSRDIVYCERFIERAGGSAPRNYWFRPFRVGLDRLMRSKTDE